MPDGLKRFYGAGDLHFITFSCYDRRKFLDAPFRRDLFLHTLETLRQEYELLVAGYVVMPEHVHLLVGEPHKQDLSVVLKVLKQGVALTVFNQVREENPAAKTPEHFWQKRFYDFNVFTEKKRIEKLRYMHRNPVKRGLVNSPEQWRWSSFRDYAYGEQGIVTVNVIFPPEWTKNLKTKMPDDSMRHDAHDIKRQSQDESANAEGSGSIVHDGSKSSEGGGRSET